ncbi:MAG: septal ring lytic transglycosylase RlpA family protein [Cellvibrionales bacterium]|nr:septal ring lytic transglycosylase RlpA family protein [Cellvibrionales bacterium]
MKAVDILARIAVKPFLMIGVGVLFVACSHQDKKDWNQADEYQRTRYSQAVDSTPQGGLPGHKIPDAIPKNDPITRAGNISPYKVFGKTYHVLPSSKGYKATGEASWYGMKFHGHKTSNGEIYDVHQMSAAHKTLPLPSYVRVTNVANGKTCVVRVNDRGPFKDGRLIDLSYAAAKKLDFLNAGTAKVRVEAVHAKGGSASPPKPASNTIESQSPQPQIAGIQFLQIGAYREERFARQHYDALFKELDEPLILKKSQDGLLRLYIGPIEPSEISNLVETVRDLGYPKPLVVQNMRN